MKTKICMLNGANKGDVEGLLTEARQAARDVANQTVNGCFPFLGNVLSTRFLDFAAKRLDRYSIVFWGEQIYSPEDPTGSAIQVLQQGELAIFMNAMFILIGQGRYELCCSADLTPAQAATIGHIGVGEHLVPLALVDRLVEELRKIDCSAGGVRLNPATLFTTEFLESLNAHEHAMLMPCTRRLVLAGVLNLPEIHLVDDEEEMATE
jgi:hypothetical protein